MKKAIIISGYEDIFEILDNASDAVYDDLDLFLNNYGYEKDEHGEYDPDDIAETIRSVAEEMYEEETWEVEDAVDLEFWWRHHGWTLDRGYGGPNYKERLADSKDWDYLFEMLISTEYEDEAWVTPTYVNDIVLFGDEGLYDDEDDEE